MTYTVQTDLAAAASIATAEAQLISKNLADLRTVVTVRNVPNGVSAVKFPVFPALTGAALGQGNTVATAALTGTSVTLTPDVKSTCGLSIVDTAASYLQDAALAGQSIGEAIVAKRNADIFAAMLTATITAGNTSAVLAEAALLDARAKLRAEGAVGNLFLVLPISAEKQLMSLYTTNTNLTDNAIRAAVMQTGFLPSIFGLTPIIYNKPVDSGAQYGVLLDPRAVGFAEQWDVRIEPQRVAEAVGFKLIGSASYDVGVIRDKLAVKIGYKAS